MGQMPPPPDAHTWQWPSTDALSLITTRIRSHQIRTDVTDLLMGTHTLWAFQMPYCPPKQRRKQLVILQIIWEQRKHFVRWMQQTFYHVLQDITEMLSIQISNSSHLKSLSTQYRTYDSLGTWPRWLQVSLAFRFWSIVGHMWILFLNLCSLGQLIDHACIREVISFLNCCSLLLWVEFRCWLSNVIGILYGTSGVFCCTWFQATNETALSSIWKAKRALGLVLTILLQWHSMNSCHCKGCHPPQTFQLSERICCSSVIWNHLPQKPTIPTYISSFKSLVKTHFFTLALTWLHLGPQRTHLNTYCTCILRAFK